MLTVFAFSLFLNVNFTIDLKAVVAPQEVGNPTKDSQVNSEVLPSRLQVIQVKSGISFTQDREQQPLMSADLIGQSPRLGTMKSLDGIQNPRGSLYFQLGTPVILGRPGYVFRDAFLSQENCKTQDDESAVCEVTLPAIQVYSANGAQVNNLGAQVKAVKLALYRWAEISKTRELRNFSAPDREGLDEFLVRVYRKPDGSVASAEEMKSAKELKGFFLFDRLNFDSNVDKPVHSPEGRGSDVRFERRFSLSQVASRIPLLSPENRASTKSHQYLIEREVSEDDQGALRVSRDRAILEIQPGQFIESQNIVFTRAP